MEARYGPPDRVAPTSALTERTVQLSTLARPEWGPSTPEWAEAPGRPTAAYSTPPRGLLAGTATLAAALAVMVGLTFVLLDLVWLPWPALIIVIVLVSIPVTMVIRLNRHRLPAGRVGDEDSSFL
jgi:hypothetical protein